ncbi:MAG: DUF1015 domain-containing protein [Nitrospirales bacterium]|nr:DUF1015 domain-containing protein [Nitrospirales bacterium]
MKRVIPFQGILYNPSKVSGEEVIAPPYDIITPEHKELLYAKSPFNIVRIDFGKESAGDNEKENKYSRARDLLAEWMKEGVLLRGERPAYYLYEVDYEMQGQKKRLRGVFCLVKIEELGNGIYPHEETRSKAKDDRLNIMRFCNANLSPIFGMYNSPEKVTSAIAGECSGETPYLTAHDSDGALHRLYRIEDPEKISRISEEISSKPIFIADGHHRYEVALEFKREMERAMGCNSETVRDPQPWDYVMMFLANMADEGLTVLSAHRMVKGLNLDEAARDLEPYFEIQPQGLDADIPETLRKAGKGTFGLYLKGDEKWNLLRFKGADLSHIHEALRDLDVVVLHELTFKSVLAPKAAEPLTIEFEMDAHEAMSQVRKGEFDAVFFLNPTGVADVERVSLAHLRMPPKSTYFYPKLLTGMVINKW